MRPPQAGDWVFPGHWEGDLIKGAGNRSAVGVLLKRSSRLVMLIKLADATAASTQEGFTAKLRSIAEPMRQTLTYDQGKERARHAELTANTGVMEYFCDPRSPWQRGPYENTNGLIRQYLPKGMDLSVHSQEQAARCDCRSAQQPPSRHPWLLPAYQRLPGHVGQTRSTQFLNSINRCCTWCLTPP